MAKDIRVKLNGELLNRFQSIKQYLGLSKDSEVFRVLINDFFRRYSLPEELIKEK